MKEKLGVVTTPPKDKTASAGRTCPDCGEKYDLRGLNTVTCPKCGTKPFERAHGKEEG